MRALGVVALVGLTAAAEPAFAQAPAPAPAATPRATSTTAPAATPAPTSTSRSQTPSALPGAAGTPPPGAPTGPTNPTGGTALTGPNSIPTLAPADQAAPLPFPAYGTPAPQSSPVPVSDVPQVVTLQQAILIAYARSPVLASARADVAIATAPVGLARSALFPSISGSATELARLPSARQHR